METQDTSPSSVEHDENVRKTLLELLREQTGEVRAAKRKRFRKGAMKTFVLLFVTCCVLGHYARTARADATADQNWFLWFVSAVAQAAESVYDWIFEKGWAFIDVIWGWVSSAFPAFFKNADLSAIQNYWGVANYWLPINETVAVVAAVYAFQVILIGYRVVKSWLENGW